MRVVCCSSGCCGVKHIREIPWSPDVDSRLGYSTGHSEDEITSEPDAYKSFVAMSGEKGTAGELMKLLINKIKAKRPNGMIQINLASPKDECDCWDDEDCDCDNTGHDTEQVDNWRPFLEKLGFSEVQFTNSNSDAIISHFCLTY